MRAGRSGPRLSKPRIFLYNPAIKTRERTPMRLQKYLADCGIAISETPADMAETLLRAMGKA